MLRKMRKRKRGRVMLGSVPTKTREHRSSEPTPVISNRPMGSGTHYKERT